ncbi:MAG: iron-containing alcohol dehydrogenase [Limnochordia bacterium]
MDQDLTREAKALIEHHGGTGYVFGTGVLDQAGQIAGGLGKNALVVGNDKHTRIVLERVIQSLAANGVTARPTLGARPNTPIDDVYRIAGEIRRSMPDVVVAVGGGSTIDAAKAAAAAACLGGDVDRFFGTGLVSEALDKSGKSLIPVVAVQTIAGSGAHLTKYANVTDLAKAQKKLIVDQALVPPRAVFDYAVTVTAGTDVTIDGILDGMSHLVEVFFGTNAEDLDKYPVVERLIKIGLPLLIQGAAKVLSDPHGLEGREMVGLATDLGACAIMIGSTNGPHLNSFSLVDTASHGRACGILNPYYAVLFAAAVERQLMALGRVLAAHGMIAEDLEGLSGRDLALAVAEGMQRFLQSLGAPISLRELQGFSTDHLERMLTAAKDPQLRMKLENMPIPIPPHKIDSAIGSVLEAVAAGDLRLVQTL